MNEKIENEFEVVSNRYKCKSIEQQTVDCMECISYNVNDIRAMVIDELRQIQDEQSNMDKR